MDPGRSRAGRAWAARDEERAGGDCSRVSDGAPAAPQRRDGARFLTSLCGPVPVERGLVSLRSHSGSFAS